MGSSKIESVSVFAAIDDGDFCALRPAVSSVLLALAALDIA
jgi:hypothetical protein